MSTQANPADAVRVVTGWSVVADFPSLDAAADYIADAVDSPTHDPALVDVAVLDLTTRSPGCGGYPGPYATLASFTRPLVSR